LTNTTFWYIVEASRTGGGVSDMINTFLTEMVVKTAKGFAWKVMIQGQPDEHMMDWAGTNYRFLVVRGQPRFGFSTEREAFEFLQHLPPECKEEELNRSYDAKGSYYPDLTGDDMRAFAANTSGL
jgi:hypothetical protein